ncbi:M23 family metallopeptidase, partial [Xanthomonas perforans]|nr:M23 family metallopeptidase [Xanthomonas perforans]
MTKDFLLEDSRIPPSGANVRAVDVPSPVAGYVARVDAGRFGAVDIYDRKGGELVARILHLDPVGVSVGDSVEYGQLLGTQSNKGLPNAGKHVHMEMDKRYYQQSEDYMEDPRAGVYRLMPRHGVVASSQGQLWTMAPSALANRLTSCGMCSAHRMLRDSEAQITSRFRRMACTVCRCSRLS